MLQNPFTSFIGLTIKNEKQREEISGSFDKSLVLIVNPETNKLEVSTGYREGGIPAKISYDEFKRISSGKQTTLKMEYEEDITWYDNFKEEAKGD